MSSAHVGDVRQQIGQLHAALAVASNFRGLARSVASFLMNANRRFPAATAEAAGRSSSASFGLGSNKSSCDGPPSMNRKMHRLARGAKCGCRVPADSQRGCSAASSERSASMPSPPEARLVRNSRRPGLHRFCEHRSNPA